MCEYIKDNDEQCGMDNHNGAFCHMHEDTEQAEQWRDEKRYAYGAVNGSTIDSSDIVAVSPSTVDSSGIVMEASCGDCGTSLRRTERLSEHENLGGQVMFVAVVECDCSEHVLETKTVRTSRLPGGWL